MDIFSKARSSLDTIFEQTLRLEFEQTNFSPECIIDLQSQIFGNSEERKPVNFVAVGNEIRAWEHDALIEKLISCKIKSLGLLIPSTYCISDIFIKDSIQSVKNAITDFGRDSNSLIYPYGNKFLGYASLLRDYSKNEIEHQFSKFIDNGGAIVSIRDRTSPLTSFMLSQVDFQDGDSTIFLCAHNDFSINMWVTVRFKDGDNDCYCPITQSFGFSNNLDKNSINLLISSIFTQLSKHYFLKTPQKAIVFDNTNGDNPSQHSLLLEQFGESFAEENIFDFNNSERKGAYILR